MMWLIVVSNYLDPLKELMKIFDDETKYDLQSFKTNQKLKITKTIRNIHPKMTKMSFEVV